MDIAIIDIIDIDIIEWMKTTWKTAEETVILGRNMYIKA